jgi:hypothetical protein
MRRAAVLLIVLVIAGCGGDSENKTVTVTAPQQSSGQQQQQQQQHQTTSEASVPDFTVPTDKEPTATTPEPSNGGTLASAEAVLAKNGYVADDPSQYQTDQTLRVLIATRKDSGDGYAKKAFFFVGGRYIGTDTSNDSAGIRVDDQSDKLITLEYALYGKNDALCCPSGSASVRYQWNGSRLVPLDPIPKDRG